MPQKAQRSSKISVGKKVTSRRIKRGAPPIVKVKGKPRASGGEQKLDAHYATSDVTEVDKVIADVQQEAAVDEAEEATAEKKKSAAATANFLAKYFQEMSQLNVLRPEEEFHQARVIEEREIKVWEEILSYQPMIERVLKICEEKHPEDTPPQEFGQLRKALVAVRGARGDKSKSQKLGRMVTQTATVLQSVDIDKIHLEAVLAEYQAIVHGGRLMISDRLTFQPRSAAFQKHYDTVKICAARAHRSRNEFVKANLRLVVSIARRFNHGRMPLADLIQEGNIGLMKAVERYDYRRGYRFSTYASWWIRHAISRALADKGREVRLPVHMIDVYHRVAKATRELTAQMGRDPTPAEIGEKAGVPAAKIEKMRTFLLDQAVSLDRPVSDEDGRRFVDFLQDPNKEEVSPVDVLANQAMSKEVRSLLTSLKPIEADILRQRFGLLDDQELTLKEIGEKYNLSRERIRQLQEQALGKMRRALQRKNLA